MFVYWNTTCFKKYEKIFNLKVYLRLGEPANLYNLPLTVPHSYSSGQLLFNDPNSGVCHIYRTENLILEVPQELFEILSDLQKINFKIYKIE